MMQFKRLALAAVACALVGLSAAAQAVIVDIDATTPESTTQTFAAGTYHIAFIGSAQGGKYDGWTYNTGGAYREAFTANFDGASYTVDKFSGSSTGYYQNFANSGAALDAFSGGQFAIMSKGSFLYDTSLLEWTFAAPTKVSFSVPDFYFADNTGGVSLSVTSAVPEPENYALLLVGLGAIGFMARRRLTS